MKLDTKFLSIVGMITVTIFLFFMDVKDIYYKIDMCGPYPTYSFLLTTPEVVTDHDVTQAIKDANGTWLSKTNQWNALALQCDHLYPTQLQGKPAHLSAHGVGCTVGGKRQQEMMFIGAHRVDALTWAAGILGDLVRDPMPSPPFTNGMFATMFDHPEREFRARLAAMIAPDDIPAIKASVHDIATTFGTRLGIWEKALCYEMTRMIAPGETLDGIAPVEHGCIWMDMANGDKVAFHIDAVAGKYFRALGEMSGYMWFTVDYLTAGNNVFLRARMRMKTYYKITHTTDGQKLFWHFNQTDLGVDGVLYIVMMINAIAIVVITAGDIGIVAAIVVRPIIQSTKKWSTYTSGNDSNVAASSRNAASRLSKLNITATGSSASPTTTTPVKKEQPKVDKDSTLAKMLLYTDLTSVSYRKPLLSALLVIDVLLAWLYVVPNSFVFAWASSLYQLGSAYLSMVRIWVIVLIVIDNAWKYSVVLINEKFAALVTEFTYITSFEIMCSTLLGIYLTFQDIMNISLQKYAAVDGQRELTFTAPGILSYYTSFSLYSYGDRSYETAGLSFIYKPLLTISSYGILFSSLVALARLIVTLAWKAHNRTLGGEVESFWRSYQRNSAEVFMNTPMRANALIRSQSMMSYRFGKSVFIRPFVYLEQNFYITRGSFRTRPAIPFLSDDDAGLGAQVNTKSYMIEGVYRDENSQRLQRKLRGHDVQIPLC